MKKRYKFGIVAVILGVIALITIPMVIRYWRNTALGEELRKEDDAWLTSLPEVPDSENAAPVINNAIERFGDFHDVFQDWDPRIDGETSATSFRDYIASKREAFDLIEKGLAYDKWVYATDYEKGYEHKIPSMWLFKSAGRVFALKGDLARLEGKQSEAAAEYLKIFQLASTLSDERDLISQMTYFANCFVGLRRLAELLETKSLAEQELSSLVEKLLDFRKKSPSVHVALETEYYVFVLTVSDILEGKKTMRELAVGEKDESGAWERFMTSKWMYDYSLDVEIYRRWGEVVKQVNPAQYCDWPETSAEDIFHEFGVRFGKPQAIMAQLAIPSLLESHKVETECIAQYRGTIVLVAINLYKARNASLPENLSDFGELVPKVVLIDPFSGKNLIYRREGDDFYLYSRGYNGVDDKCMDSKPFFEKDIDLESVPDIVFHTPDLSGK